MPERYTDAIQRAGMSVGTSFALDAEPQRQALVTAIKLNVANRKEYSYEMLRRRYSIVVGLTAFKEEKRRFCYELARELEML